MMAHRKSHGERLGSIKLDDGGEPRGLPLTFVCHHSILDSLNHFTKSDSLTPTPSHEQRALPGTPSLGCTAEHRFNHTIANHLHRMLLSYIPRSSYSAKNRTISRLPARDAKSAGVRPA